MDRKAPRAVKDNHLSWINLGYLSVAAIATVWVLVDVYSALVPDGLQNSASTENLLSSLLNLPILAGGLLFLFALYRYPLRDQDRHDWVDPSQTDSAILEDCLVLPHASEIEAKRHKSAQVEGDLTLKVGADAPLDAISEISLPYGSTIVFSDSIALDIDDYLSDEYEDIEGIDNVYAPPRAA